MGNVIFESLVWLSTVCTGVDGRAWAVYMDVRAWAQVCIHAPYSRWCNPNVNEFIHTRTHSVGRRDKAVYKHYLYRSLPDLRY